MRARAALVFILLTSALLAPAGAGLGPTDGRRVAVILDTSRSMLGSDPQRYTAQITKILSDLLDEDDELTVIRMPQESLLSMLTGGPGNCAAAASSSLALRRDASDLDGSKRRIDDLVSYDTGTYFAAPIRTAAQALSLDPQNDRMLLIVADSGGLAPCDAPLTRELSQLHESGATVAAVNLGGAGAFEGNPAFDFTIGTRNAEELIAAVALVYQRFLGSKRVQNGRVDGLIEVTIDPHVAEAFLVVAADGPLGALEQGAGNPPAARLDLDYRGGGGTLGLDGRLRGYRIARLEQPQPGRWRFRAAGLDSGAGWLLVQDSAVAVRWASAAESPRGVATTLEAELYDRITGQRLEGPCDLPGLDLQADVEGRRVALRDDGSGGDRTAGDCTFSATATFTRAGRQEVAVQLETADLDREVRLETEVVDIAWRIDPKTPERAEMGEAVQLEAELAPVVPGSQPPAPDVVVVSAEGEEVARLADDGGGADHTADDRVYTGTWTPSEPSQMVLDYTTHGGAPAQGARKPLEVAGVLELADAPAVRFEPVAGGGEAHSVLDLTGTRVEGSYVGQLTSDYDGPGSLLEIDIGAGWVALGESPVALRLEKGAPLRWPLRLRAAECPGSLGEEDHFEIALEVAGPAGVPLRQTVPLTATLIPDPWLRCWWQVLALGLGLGFSAVIVHGFWSPSRFARRLGVVLSPEENMSEGYPHSIRTCRRTGSGFYRDATVYVRDDFRLSGTGHGAIARLRADGDRVRIRPEPGGSIWRRSADGEWERLPPEETAGRFGVVYRNDPPTLFFELRNV